MNKHVIKYPHYLYLKLFHYLNHFLDHYLKALCFNSFWYISDTYIRVFWLPLLLFHTQIDLISPSHTFDKNILQKHHILLVIKPILKRQ